MILFYICGASLRFLSLLCFFLVLDVNEFSQLGRLLAPPFQSSVPFEGLPYCMQTFVLV